MKSHDFLHLYKQRSNPIKVSKETTNDSLTSQPNPTAVNVTESESRNGNGESKTLTLETATSAPHSTVDAVTDRDQQCELERRKIMLSTFTETPSSEAATCNPPAGGPGFFGEGWRGQLCRCPDCRELHVSSGVGFLLEENDPVIVYEEKAERRPSTLDAGMAALGSSLNRVQQVEALHRKFREENIFIIE